LIEYLVREGRSGEGDVKSEESNGVEEKVISVDKKNETIRSFLLLLLLLLLSRYCIRLNSDDLKSKASDLVNE